MLDHVAKREKTTTADDLLSVKQSATLTVAAERHDAKPAEADAPRQLTDGFHLIIDALKLNDIKTIYGVPGIPVSDLARMAQAEGIRVISFRHEQNAGN